MLVLASLSALVWIASVSLAVRLYPESRAERALAACVLALSILVGAIQALGWTDTLSRASLAALSSAISVVVLASSLCLPWRGTAGLRARVVLLASAIGSLARLPLDALREAWRAGSLAVSFALAWTLGLLAWTFYLAYLAPSGAWDGLWYHEPMVGFALQTGSFAEMELPVHMEWLNGYPRTSEHLMLWMVAFADKRLMDAVPSVMGAIALLASYVLVSRYSRSRLVSIGLACVLITIPGVILQMRSTYIDVNVLAAFAAALCFVMRPTLRSRDLWIAALAIGILGGTKSTGLLYVAILASVGIARLLLLAVRARSAAPLVHALAAIVVGSGLFLPIYARNWTEHRNPIWPLRYESRLLGTFEGPHDISDMQWSAEQVRAELWAVPRPGEDYHDTRRHAFGYSLTYVGLPVFVLALVAWLAALVRSLALADKAELRALSSLFVVLLLGGVTLATSPAFYWARYALPAPLVGLALVGWWVGKRPRGLRGEGAVAAMIALNGVTLAWAEPGWDVTITRAI